MSQDKLTIDRAPRATREKEARRKPWAGFQHRWIRAEINGFDDKQHVFGRLREGYELVRNEELPEEYRDTLPTIEDGKHAGVISVGGLLLARIPNETLAERNAHYNRKAREQISAVDNELMRENAHSTMRIQNPERSSRTTFGSR
jgi:hypothetical protein